MATISKTDAISLLAWQDVATTASAVGAATDVSTKLAATVFCRLARKTSASAFTAGWPNLRVEVCANGSNRDEWVPVAVFQPPTTGGNHTTLNGSVSANASSCVVTSATGITAGDLLFLGDASTANYEIMRVLSVSGTTVNFETNTQHSHSNGADVSRLAVMYAVQVDLSAVKQIRGICDNANGGITVCAEILMVTGDSIG